jgi:hypothetical protein
MHLTQVSFTIFLRISPMLQSTTRDLITSSGMIKTTLQKPILETVSGVGGSSSDFFDDLGGMLLLFNVDIYRSGLKRTCHCISIDLLGERMKDWGVLKLLRDISSYFLYCVLF